MAYLEEIHAKTVLFDLKINLICKYMYLFHLLNISDICQSILNDVVQIYNFFF